MIRSAHIVVYLLISLLLRWDDEETLAFVAAAAVSSGVSSTAATRKRLSTISISKTYVQRLPRGGGGVQQQSKNVQLVSRKDKQSDAKAIQAKEQEKQQQELAWLDGFKSALASALSAGCAKTVLQPVDAIKTLQQYTQSTGKSITILEACQELMARPGGISNFYAGLAVTVFGSMPGVALYFGVYSYCKTKFLGPNSPTRKHKQLSIALSAAIGNSVASFSRVPYEVLKQQLQTNQYASTWAAFQHIAKERNLALIFPKGGVAIQMLRDVPYAICTLLLYESLQAFVKRRYYSDTEQGKAISLEEQNKRKALDFCVGGIAGGLGSWVTNPLDVVKTRLQTNSAAYGGSVLTCTQEIWNEGGPSAFLRGSVPRLIHKVPANAFFFLFYEVFKRVLRVSDTTTTTTTTTSQPSAKVRTKRRAGAMKQR